MNKLKFLTIFIVLLIGVFKVNAQTSQAFKDAAFAATSAYNNQNLKCVEYAQKLKSFLSANSAKYSITSYKFYEIKTKDGKPFITHDDYSTTTAISQNGRHIIAVINGEVFDNLHPKGSAKTSWESKLHCVAGGYPTGFTTTEITTIK
ncbi:Papain fold toxin 2 [Algoriella xinjiangensis]|uniref:Papain fold toxin 2 n=1 Tax=Algoriella xinjiangensis TaxID=684065 RepID=A0A1I5BGW2_9FLAO|nr:papain fold toxin domain-containing protein [Algoriella xinjiangensis]SFN73910.1 Papain fold toxin 2 [Algoriella xinjiangensis]